MNSNQIVSTEYLRGERQTERARAYLEAEVFSGYYLMTTHSCLLSYKKHFSKNIYVYVKRG